jgi:hypothetical protein
MVGMKHNSKLVAMAGLLASVFLLLAACKQLSPNKNDVMLKEVEVIASALPVHPSFQQTWSGSTSKSMLASVGRHYKSTARYDEVKNFYLTQLQNDVWKLKEDRELVSSSGARVLTFSKEQYSIAIEYSGDKAVDPDWNYAINVTWNSGRAF